jgi:hypothetical protein
MNLGEQLMSLRTRLKWGLLGSLAILASALGLQADSALALWLKDTAYLLETGSAAGAVAISLVLIATV